MANIIRVIVDNDQGSKQANQGKTLNSKRPQGNTVADTLDSERNNINSMPLQSRSIDKLGRNRAGAPLDNMTGKSGMTMKQAAGTLGFIKLANQAVTAVTSNIGTFYNDTSKQNAADNVMEGFNMGLSVLSGASHGSLLGSAVKFIGGPAGAAIGAAVAIASEAVSLAGEAIELSRDMSNRFNQERERR